MNTPLSKLPPLENGDRLSRPEFERRYSADPRIKKAELIEGIVYVASPLRFEPHAEPHSDLNGWLYNYKILTPGVRLGDTPTVRLDLDNEPQPDLILFIDQICGGKVTIETDRYLSGAPELIVEIAASSASIETGTKKQVYRRNGVQEYIVWQSFENKLDWFELIDAEYQPILLDEQGVMRSRVFPGLWLKADALLSGDRLAVVQTVQAGVQSPEHQAFVEALRSR
ncbi:Uma2 family endonuclease [Leptolyngbya boryana CZ1]|uniref:Uma2 family endonuclease n=1 Tax=Leptolyngbya boryana CZ1 TaxID=3060204 RepID=A0AA96WPX1_LEPBY|nr:MULTISPECIES: Uma2 family endonuclease [Leptolyngbya]MBN8563313.1 Uma2 family endonuclease [Leptolyngbya sp. UWPOB_LEPTO1]WNZ43845.1 Uma2 family endonuclease [Leptolyngbya boryana CZ1]